MVEQTHEELEAELREQLEGQEAALADIVEALAEAPDAELEQLRNELAEAVELAKSGLLQLKQAQLLALVERAEVNLQQGQTEDGNHAGTTENTTLREPSTPLEHWHSPGSHCMFRHSDGRWYHGTILKVIQQEEGASAGEPPAAVLAFKYPTQPHRVMCRFELRGVCTFGNSCRSFHGYKTPLHALEEIPSGQDASDEGLALGSRVLALHPHQGGLWMPAEVEAMAGDSVSLVFNEDGKRAKVPWGSVSSLDKMVSGESSEDDVEDEGEELYSDEDDDDDDILVEEEGLGLAVGTLQPGAEEGSAGDTTALFADWELHTRGVASRLMANMGYVKGEGLGCRGQGLRAPLLLSLRPQGRGLGAARQDEGGGIKEKKVGKRKRGGERSRRKKFAAKSKEGRENHRNDAERQAHPGLFDVINQCAKVGTSKHGPKHAGASSKFFDRGLPKKNAQSQQPASRQSLMNNADKINEMQTALRRLEQMKARNKGDAATVAGLQRKIDEVKQKMNAADKQHSQMVQSLKQKETKRKMMKF